MIVTGVSGETGGNPVRARRREAHGNRCPLTRSRKLGKAIGILMILRRLVDAGSSLKEKQRLFQSAKSKYPDTQASF